MRAKYGLLDYDIDRLATYNAEVARGLVHTDAYQAEMRTLQSMWNRGVRAEAEANGWTLIEATAGERFQ